MQQARPLNRKSNLPLNQQFPDERDFSGGFGQASSTSRRSPVAVISKAAITLFGAGEANGQHALPLLTRASPVTVVASSLADEPLRSEPVPAPHPAIARSGSRKLSVGEPCICSRQVQGRSR